VDPRAGLNDMKKRKFLTLPGLKLRLLSLPACSQSLYNTDHDIPAPIIIIIIICGVGLSP
jgi:hypothetical protein